MVISQYLNLPLNEILILLIGAVFGAFLYYAFDLTKEYQERKRKRKILATLLLNELRTLEYALRNRYDDKNTANMRGKLPIKIFLNLQEELFLFETKTSSILLKFISSVRRVDNLWSAANELDAGEITDYHHWKIRSAAGYAITHIKKTKNVLLSAGGILPTETTLKRVNYPHLPQIGDPEFKLDLIRLDI